MSGDIDLEALVEALRADPRRLDELRGLLSAEEQPELQAALAQLAEAQTVTEQRLKTLTARVDTLTSRVDTLTEHMSTLTSRVDTLTEHMSALTSRVDALAEQMSTLTSRVDTLAEHMSALAAQTSTLAGHVNWLRGDALERRYREKGNAYLSGLARRLRALSPAELDDVLDPSIEDGTLTSDEAHHVRLLDAVYRGVRDDERCYLAVEVSVGVGLDDVRRARERADLLARTGTPTLAVVAGEWVNPEAADAARSMGVWQVTNGRATAPAA